MWSKENEKLKLFRFLGDEFLWWFCSWYASQNFLWQVFLFLEIASLKSMLNYWTIPNLTISGTPNLSTRFLTFTGNALNFLYFGSKIRFQSRSISRQQFSLNTYDDAFRGGDLHICERSCALDVQTELHFWGIDDLHLEVNVLSSSDLSRNSYS